jgi:hypothetical protein
MKDEGLGTRGKRERFEKEMSRGRMFQGAHDQKL